MKPSPMQVPCPKFFRVHLVLVLIALCLTGSASAPLQAAEDASAFALFVGKLGWARIDFKRDDPNQLALDVVIGKRKRAAAVDTGCTLSAADQEFARKLPRLEEGKLKLLDSVLGSEDRSSIAVLPPLTLGSITFTNQPCIAADFSIKPADTGAIASHPGLSGGGRRRAFEAWLLLGGDFLHRYQALLNLPERTLYVRGAEPEKRVREVLAESLRLSGWQPVPLTLHGTRFIVPVNLNGKEVRFLLDTGATHTLLGAECAREIGLRMGSSDLVVRGAGRRKDDVAITRVADLRLGQWSGRDFPMGTVPMGPRATNAALQALRGNYDGLLGMDLLSRSGAILDYPGGRMFVRPAGPAKP